ncbi:MAG: ATP-grasp domain-containing protein [Lachnospiraceae bacterium]|jgi:carbamoyl-phosphate synthase large subunit|nr:ATP-grasp domain-containing protein [Lachnospiraceae bacterium]
MNILLTSAGRRRYLVEYFKEALGGAGKVFVCNSSPWSTAFSAADGHALSPLISDPGYIPFLLGYCRENQISLVLSLFDMDLPVLAGEKGRFAREGVTLVVSGPEVAAVCNDKWEMFRFLRREGIATPETWVYGFDGDVGGRGRATAGETDCGTEAMVGTPTHVVAKGSVATAGATEATDMQTGFPLYIKPRWGMGSIGVYQAFDGNELAAFAGKCRRDIERSYLRYEAGADPKRCVIVQESVDGAEYGLDVVNDLGGRHQTTFVRRKLAMRAGETDVAEVIEHKELSRLGEKLAKALGHVACLDVDVMEKDGKYYVIDLNARFGGGYPFSHMAGARLPRAILHWAQGLEADPADLSVSCGGCFCKDIAMREVVARG